MQKLRNYYHTIKYLKPVQIYGRIWFKISRPRKKIRNNFSPIQFTKSWKSSLAKPRSLLAKQKFYLLNLEYELDLANWQDQRLEKLFLYNLHYFDFLQQPAELDPGEYNILINSWIAENKIGAGVGWEPYPLSLRIVNWSKYLLEQAKIWDLMQTSLAQQVLFLARRVEKHLQGNHVLVNAKALIFGGMLFKSQAKFAQIFAQGMKLFSQQLAEQILADGGHYERSTMYQALILEDLLDVINLLQAYEYTVPPSWYEQAKKILECLYYLTHPDGELAFFNDAALKIARTYTELEQYAQSLGIEISTPIRESKFLAATGYAYLHNEKADLFIDAAAIGPDHQPGHAHADSLSFELSLEGKRIIVNSGTSSYGISEERLRQRSTRAHNTIEIDNLNSSEVWSGFRVARRAKIIAVHADLSPSQKRISATHNGYQHLRGKILHQRTWILNAERLEICDKINGQGQHQIKIFFHLHPKVKIRQIGAQIFKLSIDDHSVAKLKLAEQLKLEICAGTYHPEFGLSIPNYCVVGVVAASLPLDLKTEIIFDHDFE